MNLTIPSGCISNLDKLWVACAYSFADSLSAIKIQVTGEQHCDATMGCTDNLKSEVKPLMTQVAQWAQSFNLTSVVTNFSPQISALHDKQKGCMTLDTQTTDGTIPHWAKQLINETQIQMHKVCNADSMRILNGFKYVGIGAAVIIGICCCAALFRNALQNNHQPAQNQAPLLPPHQPANAVPHYLALNVQKQGGQENIFAAN